MRYVKFLALLCAVTMLISGIGCMVWRSVGLAVACAVVSTYAWNLFFEIYKAEIVGATGQHTED